MEGFERPLEGPGSERRLKVIQKRFRAVSEKATSRRGPPLALLVVAVFLASGLASFLLLQLLD